MQLVNSTVLFLFIIFIASCGDVAVGMSKEEKSRLRDEAKEMFYHAYRAYMKHAYPADELMPLSCKGRYRDTEPSRGDVDDTLGNFSLTMVDTLDTLVIMGDLNEFEHAVKLVVRDVSFDSDIVVSVFETNIRVLGGLLSGHILASYLQEHMDIMQWYRGELLTMAKDLGFKLLPAFNTSTGVPHPRINLRYGLKSPKLGVTRETCTACAGTMILEFAALSRLTGEPIFEEKARRAMDYLWQQRHRTSDLMGTVLNIHNGDWVRRDSGVGAGIDSYYEYCLKAYILLGDDTFLDRFNKHYNAVMKYISQGPLLVDVHMHRPHTNSRNFMDALLAFWPGLQVLKGDIKPAIETHEMLYQVMQRHNFLPEAFTTDFQVHWGQHPLRPEFLESTYFLHKATGDSYYLEAGKKVMESLQKYARVPCGFAAVRDVRTGNHEDRMDSFVLAETFKYLYLLFASKEDILLDMDNFVFTTEAHLLPLSLARLSNYTVVPSPHPSIFEIHEEEFSHTCPNAQYLFPEGRNFAQSVRQPLKNLVEGVCPSNKTPKRRLHASEFQASNKEHLHLIRKMGITVVMLNDGRIQLVHHTGQADSPDDAEEGVLFMQEMIEISKQQSQQEQHLRAVYFMLPATKVRMVLNAGPAQFGKDLKGQPPVEGMLEIARPIRACNGIENAALLKGKIAVIERGDCMFIEKARQIQRAGAIGGIVLDNTPGTNAQSSPLFAMSGDGKDDIKIPLVFLFSEDAGLLLNAFQDHPKLIVGIADSSVINAEDKTDIPNKESSEPISEAPSFKSSGKSETLQFQDSAEDSSSKKSSEEPNFMRAGARIHKLFSKLRNLQRIKVDLDQLLALTQDIGDDEVEDKNAKNEKRSQEHEFQLALEKLVGKEKLMELDQDLQILLSRLRELVQFQLVPTDYKGGGGRRRKMLFISQPNSAYWSRPSSVNPLRNVEAFRNFMMGSDSYVWTHPLRNIDAFRNFMMGSDSYVWTHPYVQSLWQATRTSDKKRPGSSSAPQLQETTNRENGKDIKDEL